MKVAHINGTYGQAGVSGTEQSVPNTCALLEARGVQTTVLYATEIGVPAAAPGRTLHRIPKLCDFAPRRPEALIARALEVLADEAVDVVHLHQINNGHLVRAIAARWPTFYFVHNHVLTCPSGERVFKTNWQLCPQSGPAASCMSNAFLRRCASRRPTQLFARLAHTLDARGFSRGLLLGVDSQYMKSTLVASGYPADRIVVTPTVTELVEEPNTPYPAASPRVVLYVGQLSEIKGASLLIQAFQQVTAPAVLRLAGDGYLLPALRAQVDWQGVAGRVQFLGRLGRTELAEQFRACSLVVVPVRYPEPFGLVGPEAMAFARPVVGFPLGGVGEWLLDGRTGLHARPNDARDLASKVDYLLQRPDEAERMGRDGRRVWEEQFHPNHHIDALLAVYETVRGLPLREGESAVAS